MKIKLAMTIVFLVACHDDGHTSSDDCQEPEPIECDSSDDCPDDLTCQPTDLSSYGDCSAVWTCQVSDEDQICTYDLHLYCDCFGNQFGDSGTLACVDTKFDYHGWCQEEVQ